MLICDGRKECTRMNEKCRPMGSIKFRISYFPIEENFPLILQQIRRSINPNVVLFDMYYLQDIS